jgi:pyruvate/2-oxoglutarate dehydrogenase complex dihydrolipoamide acyltransferase (E2) component
MKMATQLNIPKLGMAVTEGTLVEWLVADGSAVSMGDPVYVLETDKVENEIEAPASGTLRCLGAPGETYPVGHNIGEIT